LKDHKTGRIYLLVVVIFRKLKQNWKWWCRYWCHYLFVTFPISTSRNSLSVCVLHT